MDREALPPSGVRRRFVPWKALAALSLAALGVWFAWDVVQRRATRSRGLDLADSARFDEAEPLLAKSLRARPEDAEVVEALARGYLERDDPRTEAILDRWVALRPNDPTPVSKRLAFHARRENHAPALADAERVLQLDPDADEVRRELPRFAFEAGDYKRAEQACRDSLQRNPADHLARRLLAQSLRNQDRNEEAVVVLEEALRANPNDPAALVALGHLFTKMGQPKRAIPLLRKALDDPRRWGTTRYYLALALKQDGQTDEASKLLAEVNKMREADLLVSESRHCPSHVPLKVKAARACVGVGKHATAIELLTSGISIDPSCSDAHAALADVYAAQGKQDLAEHHRRLARANRPGGDR